MSQLICFSKKTFICLEKTEEPYTQCLGQEVCRLSIRVMGVLLGSVRLASPNKNGPVNLGFVYSLYTQMLNVWYIFMRLHKHDHRIAKCR